jgi:molybdate transport repressor ModE-like protein
MRTVVISSDARKMGKTLMAESLTARLSDSGLSVHCVKLSRNGHGPDGASKSPGLPGTDTRRYSDSGSHRVAFLKYSGLEEIEAFLKELDADSDFLVLESNSVLEVMKPDFHIHISSSGEVKPSAKGLEDEADLVAGGPLDRSTAERLAGLVPALMGTGTASSISIGGKHWLNVQGKPLFGEGRMELLKAERDLGSILQASRSLGIQYKRAWVMIHDAEERVGAKLVESGRGGAGGGGTRISRLAERLLEIWERSRKDFEIMLKELEIG